MIRLLILGTGGMAGSHASAFSAIPGVEVVAGVDTNPEKLAAFCAANNIPHGFTSVGDALAWNQFDAVTNVTPDGAHYITTLPMLAAGKHVLCEKPLATNYPQAAEMAARAQQAGVVNMVNLTYRNVPAVQKAAQMVADGAIGAFRQLLAQVAQVHVDGPIEGFQLLAQHLLGEVALADDLAGIAQQALQQPEFGGGQLQQLLAAAGLLQAGLQHDIHEVHFVGGVAALGRGTLGTAQDGAYPGQQLPIIEWLGQIVVGTRFQTVNPILAVTAGGQHQHRGVVGLAQLGQHGKAVELGHHHVQQHQIEALLRQPLQPLFTILGDRDLKSLQGQNFGEQLGQFKIVVDQEYSVHLVLFRRFSRQTDAGVRV